MRKVAIVGAGISGLACAQLLQDAGASVSVFEKSGVVGGRAATRIVGAESFDHGAQYFTARSDVFERQIEIWLEKKVIARWAGSIGSLTDGQMIAEKHSHKRFVGAPHMRSLAEHMSSNLSVAKNSKVNRLSRSGQTWRLDFEKGEAVSDFDAVILSMPANQSAALLEKLGTNDFLLQACQNVTLTPCWSTMVSFAERLNLPFDGLFINNSHLSWVCRDSSKPGRKPGERWVLHATPSWSEIHIGDDQLSASENLIAEFLAITGSKGPTITNSWSKLWRFAAPSDIDQRVELPSRLVTSVTNEGLGICGDWCHGARVESAFLSGQATANEVLRLFTTQD
jgi:predicted NAD/FAD-dependent oxidoreductase